MAASPSSLGWRMPAEWEPHDATWIAWPHNRADWPGKFAPIPWVYGDIVKHLHTGEFVHLLVNDLTHEKRARQVLKKVGVDLERVRFFRIPTDRVWLRDSGPIFLTNPRGQLAMTDWHFNAWAKYDNWKKDDQVPARINKHLGIKSWRPTCKGKRLVLEGGSIDVNGTGLLLTTEECLLSPIQARNPHLDRTEIERQLCDHLGVKKVLWLNRGIVGDDTHGHVDDLARFVGPGTVVTVVEDNHADPNFEILQENLERLTAMTDLAGQPLTLETLPMPAPLIFDGQRLPASYANFYIGNEKVLMPTFNDPNDAVALATLAALFPGRTVVGIHAVDLVWGLGTLHCMTQQQPRARG
ncbi:MAG: agmatine deiminase family protein [Planctomycetes bacterium]|jgi:agmatine deiminase|nr:agmatine deiminase family protein [Planctomycetota bacterium]